MAACAQVSFLVEGMEGVQQLPYTARELDARNVPRCGDEVQFSVVKHKPTGPTPPHLHRNSVHPLPHLHRDSMLKHQPSPACCRACEIPPRTSEYS
jgi:hypothetical protein